MTSKKNGKPTDPTRFAGRIAAASASGAKSIIRLAHTLEHKLPSALKGVGLQVIRPNAAQLDAAAKVVEAYSAVYAQMAKIGDDTVVLLKAVEKVVREHRDAQGACDAIAFKDAYGDALTKASKTLSDELVKEGVIEGPPPNDTTTDPAN